MQDKFVSVLYYSEDNSDLNVSVYMQHIITYPLHRHDFYEFEYIIDGHSETEVNGISYMLNPGDVVFITPADVHSYRAVEDKAASTVTVHFTPDGLDKRFLLSQRKSCVVSCPDELKQAFIQLLEESRSNDLLSEVALKNRFETVLILFLRSLSDSTAYEFTDSITKALAYISKNLHLPLNMSDVCEQIGYSPSYFCRKFKESTGLTFAKYLSKIRLETAARMLRSTSLSVLQISFDCGYGSVRNFNREFKKMFGSTPSEYKKQ